jgi:hypothetical protein
LGNVGGALKQATQVAAGEALSLMDSINPMNRFESASRAKLDRDVNTHSLYDTGDKEAELNIMSGCQHLFLANNFSKFHDFLLKNNASLNGCVSAKLLDTLISQVQSQIQSSKQDFCDTISRVLGMLSSDGHVFDEKYRTTKDKTAAGRLIKAKFSGFNSGLEALLAQQGAWRISSGELRDEMGKLLADTVIPVYKDFYDKYSKVNFSKRHMDQYVRFTAEDAKLILGRFFGGARGG